MKMLIYINKIFMFYFIMKMIKIIYENIFSFKF